MGAGWSRGRRVACCLDIVLSKSLAEALVNGFGLERCEQPDQ